MQLKSLQIQGFKSFPDKTTLDFGNGLTAVVGPNGSGKSNISDAVRWVLGEQSTKNLRGDKMEDVIFLGSQTRKPNGFAYVALTIDNTDRSLPMDADEVTISRKLFRDGESEYRINKTAVRLRDVHELLMDTGLGRDGYSIIGQGRIEEIVSARSSQRREIFEEAAGITKYRYRKADAEKRLEAAYENLLRLKDIMAELEGRVEPLRQQAEKAQQFLELSEEKKTLEVSLWSASLDRTHEKLEQQEAQRLVLHNRQLDLQAVLDEFTCQINDGYEQIQQASAQMEETRRQISAQKAEMAQCDSDAAVCHNDVQHHRASIEEAQQEVLRHTQSSHSTRQRLEELEAGIAEKQQEAQRLAQQQAQMDESFRESCQQLEQVSQELSALKLRRAAFEQDITMQKLNSVSSATRLEEASQRMESLQAMMGEKEQAVQDAKEQFAQCKALLATIEERRRTLENERAGYEMKLASRQNTLEQQRRQQEQWGFERDQAMQRARILSDMEKNMEGYYNSVRHVMQAARKGSLSGVRGTVSQLIRTPGEYAVAVETALGSAMQHIVVENEQAAKQAIANLKYAHAGRATFLPLSVIRGQELHAPGIQEMEGYLGTAAQLVSCEECYREILSNLLGRVVVAQDLDCAALIARKYQYKFRIVTLDGQLINAGGSFTGGSTAKNSGILSRREEIDSLTRSAQALEEKIQAQAPKMEALQQEAAAIQGTIRGLEAQLRTAQEDHITYTAELRRLELAEQEAQKALSDAKAQLQDTQKKLEQLRQSSGSAQEQIAGITAELAELTAALEEKRRVQEALTGLRQQAQDAINEKRFELLNVTRDVQSLEQMARQLREMDEDQSRQTEQYLARIQQLQEAAAQCERKAQERLERKKELLELVNQEAQKIQQLQEQQTQWEQTLTQLRSQEKDALARRERLAGELSHIEEKKQSLQMEYDKVIARLWEEYSLTRSQSAELAVPVEDESRAASRLSELKGRIRALGSINVAAIQEYQEVNERYLFLKGQIEDVEQSRSELIRLIRDLTAQMRQLFAESFAAINENFQTIFQELFLGGEGKLILSDPDNVLESPIEIQVQPPGKIIKTLASLSGGEKAFVAIAIYFAILKVRPAPFCILDEIEAALDEVNVSRYARYMKEHLSHSTQFIAITHRRGTMEEADVMYGVTMQEKGVSRLLELDISQVESKLGIKG